MKRLCGLYRGIVYDNKDPKNRGRLRLRIPDVLDDEVTDWAWPCFPPGWPTVAAPHTNDGSHSQYEGSGAHSHNHVAVIKVPPRNGIVWVMFEGGSEEAPVWIGTPEVSDTVTTS